MLPTLEGIIARRVLVDFRVDPDVARRLVPAPLEPVVERRVRRGHLPDPARAAAPQGVAGRDRSRVGEHGAPDRHPLSDGGGRERDVRAAFYADLARVPAGSAVLDGAVIMRGIPHEWHELGDVPELATT